MANHKSAEKRARQTIKRNELNRARRSAIRTAVKHAETAVAAGDVPGDIGRLRLYRCRHDGAGDLRVRRGYGANNAG